MNSLASTTNHATATTSTPSQFGKITKSIVRARSEMGWQAFHVYTALLTYRSDATGLARVAIDTLASDTAIDRRHVQRGLAKLISLGAISLVGTYGPKGINVWSVALEMPSDRKPKNSILNGTFVEPEAQSAMARRATHSEVSFFREKENNPQSPRDVAGEPKASVVVLSPLAPTAKATASTTQEMPQAEPSAKTPITPPEPATHSTTRHEPTMAIRNGATIQSEKPVAPTWVEPPKAEPVHPPAFHHSLTRAEAATIMTLLAVLPVDIQQAVLSEFVAKMNEGCIHRPVGYARRLVEVAKSGVFVPSASREIAQRAESDLAIAAAEQAKADAEQAKAAAAAAAAAKLNAVLDGLTPEKLAEMRQAFIRGLPKFQRKLLENIGFDSPSFDASFRLYLLEKLNL